MREYDVLIVGAGAAGLAAARELARAGVRTGILEARDRIGGRIDTRIDPQCAAPVELGAEFIHGRSAPVFALLERTGAAALGEGGSYWENRDGTLRPSENDPFAQLPEILDRVPMNGADQSVDAFLRPFERDERLRETADWTRMLVEGFDAADPAEASMQAIVEEWNGSAGLGGEQFRPAGGYAPLMHALAAEIPEQHARLLLQTIVHEIEWRAGAVRIRATRFGAPVEFSAPRAIVTIPAGVLRSGSVRFSPGLPHEYRQALDAIAMGPVTKVVLRFAQPFWHDLRDGALRDAAFLFGSGTSFPTFWTTYPVVSPLVTAWAGGPRSEQLSGLDAEQIVRVAVSDLAKILDLELERIERDLQAAYAHDWQSDPYARGAYSYLRTGGLGSRSAFARPIEEALYLAGEAAAPSGERGTVTGALLSGISAANAVLRSARMPAASAE